MSCYRFVGCARGAEVASQVNESSIAQNCPRSACRVLRAFALAAACLAGCFAATPSANATMIHLSTHSTTSADPALLKASLDFTVAGSTLLITVTNDTGAPNAFAINQILFNKTSNVTSVSASSMPAGWSLQTNQNAANFGHFDYAITGGNGSGGVAVQPGQSIVFSFNVTGASVTDMNFLTKLSTGNTPMIVAGRFSNLGTGPGGFGGTNNAVPGPSVLMTIAGLLLIPRRRRR